MADKIKFGFESGTHALTFLLTLVTVIGVTCGAVIAQIKYAPYGIHFLEMAELDDYLRVAAKHILLLACFVFTALLFVTFMRALKRGKHLQVWVMVSAMAAGVGLFFTVPHYVSLFNTDHDFDKTPGFVKLEYGFRDLSFECLRYITRTGPLIHFWDGANARLVSVNQAKLSVMASQTGCDDQLGGDNAPKTD